MQTTQQVAGQILTIGFEGQAIRSSLRDVLRSVHPGGVIFFQRNIASVEQFAALVDSVRTELLPDEPFLAIDLEGGKVDRFRELIAPLPAVAEAVAAGAGLTLGQLAGREVAAFGLNVDYAPVLDLGLPASQNVLTSRTAGGSSEEVVRFAKEFLAGMAESNIIGCGKHFPGLGGGNLDSHLKMPCITRSSDEMWSEDLLPYRELRADLPMVMVAHAWYPELERELGWAGAERPASLSPEIVEVLLRRRIGYDGLILCDDLEMGGVLGGRSIGQAAVGAIDAGCDVLLVCRHASNVVQVHEALVHEAERRSGFLERLEIAAKRIQAAKERYGIVGNKPHAPLVHSAVKQLRQDILQFSEKIKLLLASLH